MSSPQAGADVSAKIRRLVELSVQRFRDGGDGSGGSESSESSESSEGGEGQLMEAVLAVNPGPDEWEPLLGAAAKLAEIEKASRAE